MLDLVLIKPSRATTHQPLGTNRVPKPIAGRSTMRSANDGHQGPKIKQNRSGTITLVSRVQFPMRSNFNTHEFNSRELIWFFGHRKHASERFWRKLGEIFPTSLPDLSKPIFLKSNRGKTKI